MEGVHLDRSRVKHQGVLLLLEEGICFRLRGAFGQKQGDFCRRGLKHHFYWRMAPIQMEEVHLSRSKVKQQRVLLLLSAFEHARGVLLLLVVGRA